MNDLAVAIIVAVYFPQLEHIPPVVHLTLVDITYAIFAGVTVEPVVDVLLVEELEILVARR